jgi:hypothetical protein
VHVGSCVHEDLDDSRDVGKVAAPIGGEMQQRSRLPFVADSRRGERGIAREESDEFADVSGLDRHGARDRERIIDRDEERTHSMDLRRRLGSAQCPTRG